MPNDVSVLTFRWHLKCHFKRRNPLFWHFKSNKETKTKRKNDIFDFFKCLHVFHSVFSILYKICKFCRSSRLRQAVRGLMTEFSERFPSFHCLRCQTLMWGNRLFCNNVEKMIPWRVAKKNTMEKLLKPNPLCINAKLQMPVYVNGPIPLLLFFFFNP